MMQAYELDELRAGRARAGSQYLEFLRIPGMSMGLYHLTAGSEDLQQPHSEDEVYYVTAGHAKINVGGEVRPVQAGSVLFVAAHSPHQFIEIEEDLDVLVFFAPAEYSLRK